MLLRFLAESMGDEELEVLFGGEET